MKDRPATPLGVYTKDHGFMRLELFEKLSNTGPAKERPVQVSAVEFRKLYHVRTPRVIHL